LLLISSYILIDNKSKAREWLKYLEEEFGSLDQIKSVAEKIKEKIN
jgi:hypothetical protein